STREARPARRTRWPPTGSRGRRRPPGRVSTGRTRAGSSTPSSPSAACAAGPGATSSASCRRSRAASARRWWPSGYPPGAGGCGWCKEGRDRKSTRLNSSHVSNSYAVFRLKKKNVLATVREGDRVYTNVAVHLKGHLGSFRPVDSKPAFTLNFDKNAKGQRFHGLQKIHLNN